MKKIVERCLRAREDGYTHVASVVKTHYRSAYYNVLPIELVIKNNGWIACYCGQYNDWHGPVGTIGTSIDWDKTITRVELNSRYEQSQGE